MYEKDCYFYAHLRCLVNIFELLQVFTSLALLNMLIGPLNAFPWVLNGIVEAWVSLKRVDSFLQVTFERFLVSSSQM